MLEENRGRKGDEGDGAGNGVEDKGVGEASDGARGGTANVDAINTVDHSSGAVADARAAAVATEKIVSIVFLLGCVDQ